MVKNPLPSAGDARDVCLSPGSRRSSGEGNGNTFQYSCLENPMDRGAWWTSLWGCKELAMTEHARTASIPVWKIPWTEGPGGLQPIASQRVRHD